MRKGGSKNEMDHGMDGQISVTNGVCVCVCVCGYN